jgi:hypothetical protein
MKQVRSDKLSKNQQTSTLQKRNFQRQHRNRRNKKVSGFATTKTTSIRVVGEVYLSMITKLLSFLYLFLLRLT